MEEFFSALPRAVDAVLAKPDCMVDDTFPERFVECLELLVANCDSASNSNSTSHGRESALALIEHFTISALANASTTLHYLAIRVLPQHLQLLKVDVILRGLQSAICSSRVSLRDAAFSAAGRIVKEWTREFTVDDPCPILDGWFMVHAIKSLTDTSLFVASSAREFLSICWYSEYMRDGASQDSAVISAIIEEAVVCADSLKAMVTVTKADPTQGLAPSASKDQPQATLQRTAAFLAFLSSVLRRHDEVLLEAVVGPLEVSQLLGAVLRLLEQVDSHPPPEPVVTQLASLVDVLCACVRSHLQLESLLARCGWCSRHRSTGDATDSDCILLDIPHIFLALARPDLALSLLAKCHQHYVTVESCFGRACMLRLTATIHLAAGLDAAILQRQACPCDVSFALWLETVEGMLRKEGTFTKLLCSALSVLERTQCCQDSSPLSFPCLASALHLLATSCGHNGSLFGDHWQPSAQVYGNEKLAKALVAFVSSTAKSSPQSATALCTSETSDLVSPLAMLINCLQSQQFGISITLRLLSAIQCILTSVPPSVFCTVLCAEETTTGSSAKRPCLPTLRLLVSGQKTGGTGEHVQVPSTTGDCQQNADRTSRIDHSGRPSTACAGSPSLSAPTSPDECHAHRRSASPHTAHAICSRSPTETTKNVSSASEECGVRMSSASSMSSQSSPCQLLDAVDTKPGSLSSSAKPSNAYALPSRPSVTGHEPARHHHPGHASTCSGCSASNDVTSTLSSTGGTVYCVAEPLAECLHTACLRRDWEVRDSLVTLAASLLKACSGAVWSPSGLDCLSRFLEDSAMFASVCTLLSDSAAFVRSSTLLALPAITGDKHLLACFLRVRSMTLVDLLRCVTLTLQYDADEVVRRSAARVLRDWSCQRAMQSLISPEVLTLHSFEVGCCSGAETPGCSGAETPGCVRVPAGYDTPACYHGPVLHANGRLQISNSNTSNSSSITGSKNSCGAGQVPSCLSHACHMALVNSLKDHDWEVKTIMLSFWRAAVTQTHSTGALSFHNLLQWMCQSGCSAIVAELTDDCDSAVAEAALKLVGHLDDSHQLFPYPLHPRGDFSLSTNNHDIGSLPGYLYWCKHCVDSHSQSATTPWIRQQPSLGFEPVPFLQDVLHSSSGQGRSDEEKVIIDCY